MERNSYLGQILSIDKPGTRVRDDAFSVDIDEEGNYIANIYIADPITNHQNLIDNITRLYMSEDGADSFFVKEYFRDCGLSERDEKKCFCFSFVLDKNANILSFNATKKKIQIDIEMDYDDVFDTFDDENELSDYLSIINDLTDSLYFKRSGGKEFDSYGKYVRYNLSFPREFIIMVNKYLANILNEKEIPFIYDVKYIDSKSHSYAIYYYTSEPTKTMALGKQYYYGDFTSPILRFESLKDLEIFNATILEGPNQEQLKALKEKYAFQLKDYIRSKSEGDIEYCYDQGGSKK